jgi:flagellar assembly protein FliH
LSREWSAESFAPAGAAPVGFVPAGLFADAPAVAPHALSDLLRQRRSGFAAGGLGPGFRPASFAASPRPAPGSAPIVPVVEPEIEARDPVATPNALIPDIDVDAIFAQGVAEGQRLAAEMAAADAAACATMLTRLSGAAVFDRRVLAAQLQQTVLMLVGQLVGEVGIAADKLAARVQGAVDMLADVTEPARLHLHPADLALVADHLAGNVAAVANATMERGSFRLETMSATVEDGPALWLDQLAAALERVALPA